MSDKVEETSEEEINISNNSLAKIFSYSNYDNQLKNGSPFLPYNLQGSPISFIYKTDKNIEKLTNQLEEKNNEVKKLREELKQKGENNELLNKLHKEEEEQKKIIELKYLLTRIHPIAPSNLLEPNNILLSKFSNNESVEMTVMSIDIRKSTELMLKAITPDKYAEFIFGLTEGLKKIVVNKFGVFDKFTGDGILAYFPIFYSGENGILNCCITSQECHDFFNDYYRKYYDNFSVVLDTGLGIGIDHGIVKIVTINNEQTIVGSSVVYACRLSGAPAGKTYLNRTAFKNITKYGINSKEARMEIKGEGNIIVYELERIVGKDIIIPDWVKNIF